MKRFILRLGMFVMIVVLCDIVVGLCGQYMVSNAKGGTTERMNYLANKTTDEMLVFGSSRAVHHYDPDIFENALGVSAYNCGFDGNGIICAYGFIGMVMERYYPQILIYDIASGFDLKIGDDNMFLGRLRYFYDKRGVDSIFWSVDVLERYKMVSRMYQYNSVFPQLMMDNLLPFRTYHKGFVPIDKDMSASIKPMEEQIVIKYDSLKLHYIERLIADCKDKTLLVFAVSPMYENTNDEVLAPVKALCEEYGVPLLNHYTDTAFNYTREYFSDRTHLNRTGATEYSKVVAGEIKRLIEQQ